MSVKVIEAVLDRSRHSGTALLMLVVLADYSDEDGNSYPAVASLARKCRMKPRNANYILNALQASGELRVMQNEGPKGTNRYRIMLVNLGAKPLHPIAPLQRSASLQPDARTPAMECAKPLQPIADEPSLNRQEPSGKPLPRPKRPRLPNCPHKEIVHLYHQQLPELPRVKLLDTRDRLAKLTEFWSWVLTSTKSDGTRRAETAKQALQWIADYFARAGENDFVMGRSGRGPGHENWRCTLDYLLSDRGKTQVIERTEARTA